MTRYTVVWVGSALDELADLWVSAPDRSAVTAAADAIDQELRDDVPEKGRDLSEGLRVLAKPPLQAIFAVREDDRIAEVLRVRSV
jgi:plasmid stabilization system protein ParE